MKAGTGDGFQVCSSGHIDRIRTGSRPAVARTAASWGYHCRARTVLPWTRAAGPSVLRETLCRSRRAGLRWDSQAPIPWGGPQTRVGLVWHGEGRQPRPTASGPRVEEGLVAAQSLCATGPRVPAPHQRRPPRRELFVTVGHDNITHGTGDGNALCGAGVPQYTPWFHLPQGPVGTRVPRDGSLPLRVGRLPVLHHVVLQGVEVSVGGGDERRGEGGAGPVAAVDPSQDQEDHPHQAEGDR